MSTINNKVLTTQESVTVSETRIKNLIHLGGSDLGNCVCTLSIWPPQWQSILCSDFFLWASTASIQLQSQIQGEDILHDLLWLQKWRRNSFYNQIFIKLKSKKLLNFFGAASRICSLHPIEIFKLCIYEYYNEVRMRRSLTALICLFAHK